MATTRQISKVEAYQRDDGAKRCKVTLADGTIVPLHELSRPELQSAARLAFPGIPGNVWLKLQSDTIRTLIRNDDEQAARVAVAEAAAKKAPEAVKPNQGTPRPPIAVEGADPFRAKAEQPLLDETVQRTAVAGRQAPEDQLADAIRQLAKGGVDEAQVRQLVTEEVKRQVIEEGITRIEVTVANHSAELPKLHHEVLPEVIAVLAQGLNVFLVGPAGSGKSTVAHQAAEALDLPFYAISLGPTTPTSKLFGFVDAQGQYRTTAFRTSYDDESGERAGVFLFDEFDNGHPGLVAEVNQATANGYCAFADAMVKRSARSRIVATGNTFGRGPDRLFVGRNILDAATLDRFVTIEVGIDERLERKLALAYANDDNQATIVDWIAYVQGVRRKVEQHKLPIVVSPRSTIDGAKLLAAGLTVERVKEIRLFAGIGTDVRAKIQ